MSEQDKDKDKKTKGESKTLADTPRSKKEIDKAIRDRDAKKANTKWMIPANHPWAGMWKVWAGLAVVGTILSGIGYMNDAHRFAFSYLTAFAWGVTLALGGLFFVMLQHLTSAGWSVVVRRGAEHVMATLPLFLLLFVPIVLFKDVLYPWNGEAAHAPSVLAKHAYLNFPFWVVRAFLYFAVWIFLATRLFNLSREQDASGAAELTNKSRSLSAPGMLAFGVTVTLMSFDWLSSLEPEWYSTMFPVYLFGGSVLAIMAFLNLLYTRMQGAKLLVREVTAEHFHDLGKLMFAFTVFWAYTGFCQYLLIWYANIPDETVFFYHRQEGGWGTVGIVLVLGGFFFPFFLMLSRHTKRWVGPRAIGSAWILAMHYVDMYWIVMPNHDKEFAFNPVMDLGAFFLVAGLMMAWMFKGMADAPLVPAKDPRLARSLAFENV